jgi:peroxiredoxin
VPLSGPAQDFSVTTLDGQTLRLSDLRGKTVVLNLWASWCGRVGTRRGS